MKLLFQDNSIKIYYDSENHFIIAEWYGYQTVDFIKAGCEKILDYIKEYKVQKVLYDNTKVEGIWSGASVWVGSIWCSELSKTGLLQLAWVYSNSAFSRFSTDEALKHVENKKMFKTFEQKNEAIRWLSENN